jgi:type IV secretory pathway TraG/TraD family ATPase VirD4
MLRNYCPEPIREAMDTGKILLFNLSDGILGEHTSQLLGQLVVSKIQMATMSRMDTPAAKRRPFYLYLDEFQTFTEVAETSYEEMLSRSRKYKLGLILAHQQPGQLTKNILQEIFGNVTTIIAFSVA